MPLADSKKAQTIRNLWYTRVAKLVEEADQVVAAIRAAIVANGLAGEFAQAERDAMLVVETDLSGLAATDGITAAETRYRPHHATEQDTVGLEI